MKKKLLIPTLAFAGFAILAGTTTTSVLLSNQHASHVVSKTINCGENQFLELKNDSVIDLEKGEAVSMQVAQEVNSTSTEEQKREQIHSILESNLELNDYYLLPEMTNDELNAHRIELYDQLTDLSLKELKKPKKTRCGKFFSKHYQQALGWQAATWLANIYFVADCSIPLIKIGFLIATQNWAGVIASLETLHLQMSPLAKQIFTATAKVITEFKARTDCDFTFYLWTIKI